MEIKNTVIVNLDHVYDIEPNVIKNKNGTIPIQVAEIKKSQELYFLIKKGEEYDSNTKYSIINYIEDSFSLIHPSIINIMKYSINKPYLYYEYLQEPKSIDDINLTYENIQIILIGLAEGLSYLVSKGYYYPNFTKSTIIIDKEGYPKLIDYINFEDANNGSEENLLLKYINIMNMLIGKKIEENGFTIHINENLKLLIERARYKNNSPTFNDFITFLKTTLFAGESSFIRKDPYQKYLEILHLKDKKDTAFLNDNYKAFDSIDKILDYFYENKHKNVLNDDELFLLNSLTENHIKQLTPVLQLLKDKLIRYSYNEDISLIIPNWKELCDKYWKENPYVIYKELIIKIEKLEKQKNAHFYDYKIEEDLKYQIDALRIQAIRCLKKASQQKNIEAQIELAVQYVKNYILPSNLPKALKILKSITGADETTKALIDQMIKKLNKTINDTKIENIINLVPEDKREIIENAQNKRILPMLHAGFAFYTGFNGFPVILPLSVQFYKEAAIESPNAMAILGYLYFNGIVFPQNLEKARKCFKLAADKGCIKAEIIDCLIRKHVWRSYLIDFDINKLFNYYIQSMSHNDAYHFPIINYYLDRNLYNKSLFTLHLRKEEEKLKSNCGTFLYVKKIEKKEMKSIKRETQDKILISSDNFDDITFAKLYYYGQNGYPVNYSKSANYYKKAADKGDSEAQWRYAMMCFNSVGHDSKDAEYYFRESARQNNIKGKFYYTLFLKQKNDILNNNLFKTFLKECCDSEDPDAMYYYAMILEENQESKINQSIEYYKNAAELGHFDSLIRLNYLYKGFAHVNVQKYLELSVGIINEKILVKLIHYYDKLGNYEQSNILIQIGILLNQQLFNLYYAYHFLYGRGVKQDIERAKKLANFAFIFHYQQQYQNKYIYLKLQVLVINNEHGNALEFLLEHKKQLNEKYTKYFHEFYIKFNKNLARRYFIPACFCCENYRMCYDLIVKGNNEQNSFLALLKYLQEENNPFIMAIVGKAYKIGKVVIRNLEKAIQYFARSAELQCPLGYYYIGKEYFYGRYIDQNYTRAKKYLLLAMKKNAEPRAGYFLYKISKYRPDLEINGLDMLKIGVLFGHKKALFTYGMLLYHGKNIILQDKKKAIKCIRQASFQNYKKAIQFCILHNISMKKNKDKKLKDGNKRNESLAKIMKKQNEFSEGENDSYSSYSLSSELSINECDDSISMQDNKEDKNSSNANNIKKVYLNFDDDGFSDLIEYDSEKTYSDEDNKK